MPPKAPNLKFKPKLVLHEEDATVRAPAPQSTDDLSLVQLARLQGLYVDKEQANRSSAEGGAAATSSSSGQQPQTPASPSAMHGGGGSSSSGRAGGGGGGGGRREALYGNAEGNAEETQGLSALLRPKTGRGHHLSAHAALEEASRRHMDLSNYPETAPPLPLNSMNAIVSPAMARQGALMHTSLYPPLPLDASLPSRLAAGAQQAESGVVAQGPPSHGGTTVAPSTAAAGGGGSAPLDADGTAFLREAEREQQRAYEANMRFYEEHLRPALQQHMGTAASGELMWLQIPRFHENPPFSFMDLPPGKVGELKVLRSGRMVMEVAGVYYDVAVEGYDEVGNDGACAMAVATQPSTYPSDPTSMWGCYELGLLQKKLICTPTLE
jgi:hypothetical protein